MAMKTELVSGPQGGEPLHSWQPKLKITLDESRKDEYYRSFKRDGYTVVRSAFDPLSLEIYATYALMMRANNRFGPRDDRQGFNDRYGDTLMESILIHLQPAMEQATGLSLLPTYSFLRIYETGAVLTRHTDRHACEISASLTIGSDAPEPWPLCLESNLQPKSITLEPGDMLMYRGREVPHWREPFGGRYWIQAFFHYVDADGPLSAYKFDGRPCIGILPDSSM